MSRPIQVHNPKATLSCVRSNEHIIEVDLNFTCFQTLFGRSHFFFVIRHSDGKTRTVYYGRLPKKKGTFIIKDREGSDHLKMNYEGTCSKGKITFPIDYIPKDATFYFQLGQSCAPYEETQTLSFSDRPMPSKEGVVALIPCYNVEKYCANVIEKTLPYVEKILLVNDGSMDGTLGVLQAKQKEHPDQIEVLSFDHNRGKGFVLIDGFKHCLKNLKFKALVTLDSDAQHRPEEIPSLIQSIYDGEHLVVGSRAFRRMPFKNRVANTLIAIFLRHFFPHAPNDTQSGYRALNPKLAEELTQQVQGGKYETEFRCILYALRNKKHIRSMPIETIYIDNNASSSFSSVKDSLKILKVLLDYALEKKST